MKNFYSVNKHGILEFNFNHSKVKRDKSGSIWENEYIVIFFLLLCFITDLVNFTQLFSCFLYDSLLLRIGCVIGFLITFEVNTLYIGINLKRKQQKHKVNTKAIITLGVLFLLAVIVNFILRVVSADASFPDLSSSATSIYGNVSQQTRSSSKSIYYAIGVGLIPVISSAVSGIVCFFVTDPLKKQQQNLTNELEALNMDINIISAIIEEYWDDDKLYKQLTEEDDAKYQAAYKTIIGYRNYYCNYVRLRLKEHIGTAEANSAITRVKPEKFVALDDILIGDDLV